MIIGKLSKDRGKYGYKLSVNVPANLQQPAPGVYATLTSFITKVNGSKKGKGGVPYIALKALQGRQAELRRGLRVHRRDEAVAHDDGEVQEVATVAPSTTSFPGGGPQGPPPSLPRA